MGDKPTMTNAERTQVKLDLLHDARRDALDSIGVGDGAPVRPVSYGTPPDVLSAPIEHVVSSLTASMLDSLIAAKFTGRETDRVLVEYREVLRRIATKVAVAGAIEALQFFDRVDAPEPKPSQGGG